MLQIFVVERCDPCWSYFRGRCYYFSDYTTHWKNASTTCIEMRAHLAVITSAEEDGMLIYLAKDRILSESEGFWLDGTDLADEGIWTWATTGQNLTYTNWAPDQPDNMKGMEHCLELNKRMGFKWNDEVCKSIARQFICKKSYTLNSPPDTIRL